MLIRLFVTQLQRVIKPPFFVNFINKVPYPTPLWRIKKRLGVPNRVLFLVITFGLHPIGCNFFGFVKVARHFGYIIG